MTNTPLRNFARNDNRRFGEDANMPKAILEHGLIRPLEPLPPDWRDGQELRVEKADSTESPAEDIDRDFAELATLCAQGNPDDDAILTQALHDARQISKEQVRRSMGLP